MKKYTLFNQDQSISFETDFIPTACAFTSHEPSAYGGKQLRPYVNEGVVAKAQQLEAMKRTGLTQKQLADMVGYSSMHINKYFKNKLNGKFQVRSEPDLSDKIDRAIGIRIAKCIAETKRRHVAEISELESLKIVRTNPETDGGGE